MPHAAALPLKPPPSAYTPRWRVRAIFGISSMRSARTVLVCLVALAGCGGVATKGSGNEHLRAGDASGAGEVHAGGANSMSDGGEHLVDASARGAGGATAPDTSPPSGGATAVVDASPPQADARSCKGHKTGDDFTKADCACLPPGCAVCEAPAFCGPLPGNPPYASPFAQCTALVGTPPANFGY